MADYVTRRPAEAKARGTWLPSFAAATLLVAPFLIFLRHHDYPVQSGEALTCLGLLFAVGFALGAPLRGNGPIRQLIGAFLFALLGLLFVDVQTDVLDESDARAMGIAAGIMVVCLVLRARLAALVCVMGVGLMASTLILPVSSTEHVWERSIAGEPRADLPPVLHLILDEQIGVDSIPIEFDPDRRHADALRDFYIDRGFDVYGGAYAISTTSYISISNIMDWNIDHPLLGRTRGIFKHVVLKEHAYFDAMTEAGYRIVVHQSDYLEFCSEAKDAAIVRCSTYPLETIAAIRDAKLADVEKSKLMLGMYARLSQRVDDARSAYARFRRREEEAGRTFWPEWSEVGRVSAASVLPVIDALRTELANAEPGTLYFAHLLLPHYPYAYDSECRMRERAAEWLASYDKRFFPMANDVVSRAVRYPLYLEQVQCLHSRLALLFDAMRENGRFDATRIIVHGDHGSRVIMAPLSVAAEPHLQPRDYVDGHATLFAHKPPNATAPGHYDWRLLPVNRLLEWAVTEQPVPDPWSGEPTVFLGGVRPVPRPMPGFRAGRILPTLPTTDTDTDSDTPESEAAQPEEPDPKPQP